MTSQTPQKIGCPSCGADLDLPPYGKVLTCAYCGTKSTLPSAPPPAAVVGMPPKIALVVVNEGRRWDGNYRLYGLIGLGIAILVMVSMISWLISYSYENRQNLAKRHREAMLAKAYRQRGLPAGFSAKGVLLGSPRPLAADVDADGVDDAVLWIRTPTSKGAALHVVALDGKTLKERWRSGELGRGLGTPPPRLFREGVNLLASSASTLVALRLVSGERRWSAVVPDRVERITRAEKVLTVTAVNGQKVSLRADTGAAAAADDESGGDEDDEPDVLAADGNLTPAHASTDALIDLEPRQWSGLRVVRAFCPAGRLERLRAAAARPASPSAATRRRPSRYSLHGGQIVRRSDGRSRYRASRARSRARYRAARFACDHEIGLAYVSQTEGTPVGFLVGYDRDDRSEKWRLRLPPADSVARLYQPPLVAFHGDHALVAFVLDGRTLHLRRVHLESGKQTWHASVKVARGRLIRGVGLGRTRAFAHVGDRIFAFDAKSGEHVKDATLD